MIPERTVQLELHILTDGEADDAELARLARDLRGHLLKLDIESADPTTAGPAPPGTRADELLVAGALTVLLTHSSELFTALVSRVESWISPHDGRGVEIKINNAELKLTGVSRKQQRELTQFWLDHVDDHADQ